MRTDQRSKVFIGGALERDHDGDEDAAHERLEGRNRRDAGTEAAADCSTQLPDDDR